MKPSNTPAYALHCLAEIFAKGQAWCNAFEGQPAASDLMRFLSDETQELVKNPIFSPPEPPARGAVVKTQRSTAAELARSSLENSDLFPLLDGVFLEALRLYVSFDALATGEDSRLSVTVPEVTDPEHYTYLELAVDIEKGENMGTEVKNWWVRRCQGVITPTHTFILYQELSETQHKQLSEALRNLFLPHMR